MDAASAVNATGDVLSVVSGSAQPWLWTLLLGSFSGAAGQLVRAISGFAKITRGPAPGWLTEDFRASTLVVSILVGATASAVEA